MISVIVTTYNIEKYIEECLNSVLAQTYLDLEIIVVDDGSNDSTPGLIASIAKRDARIKPVLMPENTPGGVAVAANVGMSHATGEYIGFVDGDDWCEPYMFEKLVTVLEATDSQVAIGDFKNYDEVSGSYYDPADKRLWLKGLPLGEALEGVANKKALLAFNPVPWRKLYRRDFLEANQIRFPEGDYFYEDNPFHWFCLTKGERFVLIPDCLCYHRMNRVGQTMSSGDKRLLAMYEHHRTIFTWLTENDLYETYKEDIILWVVNHSCWIYDAIRDEFKPDVIRRLGEELGEHDSALASELLGNPDRMGSKGRNLAAEAMGDNFRPSGGWPVSRGVGTKFPLAAEALRYCQEFGIGATVRKVVEYLYRRMPMPVRKVIGKLRSNSEDTSIGMRSSTKKELRDIRVQLETTKLLTMLGDEKVARVEKKVDQLQSDIDEIKVLLSQKRD
ncbi:Glycosyl transferase family 2 [Alloalcanivorax dieselolei B5]|uniref:Glycosyl transferase family 2 n=1 Tax=Alcanivorax dieselolei (strain DSM 16502 / CGMCC 1.3690 / MCCC 1A00001 / B-5) TaxID=930169 RepID=K0CEK1_ALCDB|nr:glycosyltransferase family 2 protein [Alloalcanivorax dieselolei]AFT70031.1 Glycosyl transferase family 2 [Alloalcanivorax dieselolei B5]GGK09163.1 hypothetical protein GCM10007426_41730 [Alloalcanivorax dieselolei]